MKHMTRYCSWLTLLWAALCAAPYAGAETLTIQAGRFEAVIERGSVVGIRPLSAPAIMGPHADPRGAGIHSVSGAQWAAGREIGEKAADGTMKWTSRDFPALPGSSVEASYRAEPDSGDLVIRQQCCGKAKGVWGVSWSLAEIPLDYAILVPGGSGLRLSRDTPGTHHQFDYPMSWESQFVVVEGQGRGCWVWAEDSNGRFKRLVVERRPSGWRLGFVTINDAPFDELTGCESVPWHLAVYEGDWRVPARRYRDWFENHCRPVRVESQQPDWVREIRACVIMGLETDVLEGLAARLDPRQTLLYLPDWREAGYDRNYPDYSALRPRLEPFLRRARELGFRTMLHVNYFGVDPLHPAYRQFEPFQVRDPWGAHEKQWWVWPPEKPDIRFAYINPACKAWREHFVTAMAQLCRRTEIDALHLDQTLCIYNDHNGRIDGLSMLEGNIALHRQLREALPKVALSGEGLNEVTCRYEAFAQRHVWGLDHAKGSWDRRWLNAAHPISSYVLRPFTTIYGYLGCAPPESDQLYAAWNEAYRHWGVIPTLKPTRPLSPTAAVAGFERQFFDEAGAWQKEKLQIDVDGPWPAEIAFPYRTSDGRSAAATRDRRFTVGDREVSRTVTGVTEIEAAGVIPNWLGFDECRLLGLDPRHWYPYIAGTRDQKKFHVCRLPKQLALGCVAKLEDLAVVQTRNAEQIVADLAGMLERAVCGSRPVEGKVEEMQGPVELPNGANVGANGEGISAHPPWKIAGSGEAFARFTVALPADGPLWFIAGVGLDAGAVGPDRSDGVTFLVRATDGKKTLSCQLHNDTAERRALRLDLTPLAGRTVAVELAVGPGPKGSPSFDWARWHRPRIEHVFAGEGTVGIICGKPWTMALGASGPRPIRRVGDVQEVMVPVPGAAYFLEQKPDLVRMPLDLSAAKFRELVVSDSGQVLDSAQYAGVKRCGNIVAGTRREGLFAHPPDHGRTMALFPLTLPAQPARLETWIGIRDGESDGVTFAVEINGREVAGRKMMPGRWEAISLDLGPWAGQSIVLALIADSDGPFNCDWASWGEPRLK